VANVLDTVVADPALAAGREGDLRSAHAMLGTTLLGY